MAIDAVNKNKIILDPMEKTELDLTIDNLSRCSGTNTIVCGIKYVYEIVEDNTKSSKYKNFVKEYRGGLNMIQFEGHH